MGLPRQAALSPQVRALVLRSWFGEMSALLLVDRQAELLHHLQHVFPQLAPLAQRLVAQQVGRMKRRQQRYAAIGLPLAAQPRNADGFAEQPFDRGPAEGHEDPGLDEIDLFVKVRNASSHLLRGW